MTESIGPWIAERLMQSLQLIPEAIWQA